MARPEGIEPPPPSSKHGILSIELRAVVENPRAILHIQEWHSTGAWGHITGADNQNRTGDLFLTKEALYRLSHISKLERVKGIEPSTKPWQGLVLTISTTPAVLYLVYAARRPLNLSAA